VQAKVDTVFCKGFAVKFSKTAPQKIGRDSGTGKFIPVKDALRRPATTTVETIKKPTKPKN
jgi:hypothetical protein